VPAELADAGHVLFHQHFHQRLDFHLLAGNRLGQLLMHSANGPAGFRIIDACEVQIALPGVRSRLVHAAAPSDVTAARCGPIPKLGETPDVTSNSLPWPSGCP
jgi:hypothetical protein